MELVHQRVKEGLILQSAVSKRSAAEPLEYS